MRKLLCVILCAVIIILAAVPLKISIEKDINLAQVRAFSEEVTALNKKYDESPKYSVLKFNEDGEKIAGACNNRLILKGENAESQKADIQFFSMKILLICLLILRIFQSRA